MFRHRNNVYDKIMRKIKRINSHPTHQECYNLDDTIVDYLIPRLKLFLIDSERYVDWNSQRVSYGKSPKDLIKEIISDLEYIREWKWADLKKCEAEVKATEPVESWKIITKELDVRAERAFNNLGKVFFYLWW